MTSEIRANTLKNRVGLGTVSYTNTGIVVSGIVTANSFSGPYNGTDIVGTGITLTSTDTGSSAGPELKLFRNSASPADADYLGQIKFAGESDTSVERNYAKITGKILDASNGTEDGILEFAHIKAGSQTITGRWRSDSLQLLNGTSLTVAGTLDVTGVITAENHVKVTDSGRLLLGTGSDFQLFHNGSGSFIDAYTNNLQIRNDGTELIAEFKRNLSVDLYYDGTKRFETKTNGAQVNGSTLFIRGGTGEDSVLQFISNNSASYNDHYNFRVAATGAFALQTEVSANNFENLLTATQNGAVELYHNNVKKLETKSTGVLISNQGNNRILDIHHTNGTSAYVAFLDQNTTDNAAVRVGAEGNDFKIFAGSYERLRIDSSGQLLAGTQAIASGSVTGGLALILSKSDGARIKLCRDASGVGNSDGFELVMANDDKAYIWNRESADMLFGTGGTERLRIDSGGKVLINSSTVTASYGGKLQVTNTNFAMNSFANNQHAQTLLFAKSRATSGSGGTIVGSGDFCGHIEWYADDGENTENQIAKISGQMDGSPGVNDTPGKLLFYTTADGANTSTLRMQITNGGVMHIGSTAVSNTIPTGGLDLQGNNTNCILEMGNPLPNYSAGRVPTFRITTRDADKAVDLSSMWGGTNGIYKHITMAGGATIFYNGTNDTEIVRITGSALMVGTTSDSSSTQAKGISLNNDGAMVSRRDGVMHYYKSISTGGYYANIFLSANTTVGSIFFNSGGTQFNTSSDYRRKENVVSLTDGISKLKQLKPYRFNFKDNPSETVDGFLAHEAQEIVPHTVTGTKDQVSTSNDVAVGIASTVGEPIYQQMDLSKLVPLLTAALQDEISKREALEARVAALEG